MITLPRISWLKPLSSTTARQQTDALLRLRDRLSRLMFAYAAIVLPLSMIYIVPVYLAEGKQGLLAVDALFWLFMVCQLFFFKFPRNVNRFLAIGASYAMALIFLATLGPFGVRPAWLVVVAVFAAALFGTPGAVTATGTNALLLIGLHAFMRPTHAGWGPVYTNPPDNWWLFVCNTSLLTLACGLMVSFLLNRLDRSLCEQREAAVTLQGRSRQLEDACRQIQNEIEQRDSAEKALARSEAQYRLMAENVSDVILTADLKLNLTYVSPSVHRSSGYDPDEFVAAELADLMTPDSLGAAFRTLEEELAIEARPGSNPDRARTLELEFVHKDGSTFWSELNLTFLRDAAGKAVGILGVSRDISERKQMEAQLCEARKLEAIGTMAGGIAHDFNNILGVIVGYTEMAAIDAAVNPRATENLARVIEVSHRAKDLVHQILTFSRKVSHDRRLLDLGPIVIEALRTIRSSLPADIVIQQRIEPGALLVEADATQIHQVMMNLCVNAAHAMAESGGVLDVSLKRVTLEAALLERNAHLAPGRYLKLSVGDSGHGIAPALVERIFDPYFTTKSKGEGTGLGLAVVEGIVKNYGGAVLVSSEIGKGARFDVYLPPGRDAALCTVGDMAALTNGGKRSATTATVKVL